MAIIQERNVIETPKLVRRLSTSRAIMRTSLKVKVTRLTNAEIGSASYLPNGKAYEVQSWYTDGGRRPATYTSVMTSKVKGQDRKVM